jgi:uncharacterized membrane protein YdfJ with MMPL/SSD domain
VSGAAGWVLAAGLAIAVAAGATLVRCILVPATMTLLGPANWRAPPAEPLQTIMNC